MPGLRIVNRFVKILVPDFPFTIYMFLFLHFLDKYGLVFYFLLKQSV